MFFDGKGFSSYLSTTKKVPDISKKLEYDGNAVILKCVDIKMFGGAKRLALNLDGEVLAREQNLVPITMRDPFRLMEGGTFRVMTHLIMKPLSKGVIARIVPTPVVAKSGILFAEEYIKEGGELWVTIHTLRRIELAYLFPFAMLVFIPEQIREKKAKATAGAEE